MPQDKGMQPIKQQYQASKTRLFLCLFGNKNSQRQKNEKTLKNADFT